MSQCLKMNQLRKKSIKSKRIRLQKDFMNRYSELFGNLSNSHLIKLQTEKCPAETGIKNLKKSNKS